jgi:uncharacterized protein YicC (UPF0701 family)
MVEVRSLNGKFADVRIKTVLQLGQHEIELRKMILDKAVRGKIDVVIDIKGSGISDAGMPNGEMIKAYFANLKGVATELEVLFCWRKL